MANIQAPFGFRYIGTIDGQGPDFGLYPGKIAAANTSKIFTGDVLKPISGGYFDVQAPSAPPSTGEAVGGVAVGFSWVSKTYGSRIWRPWWPGNGDANGDVEIQVAMHPQALFEVQALLGPITQANVGQTANFAIGGGGNQLSGISSFSLDDSTLGSTDAQPFRVYQIIGAPSFPVPSDPTQPYNLVKVAFNNLSLV